MKKLVLVSSLIAAVIGAYACEDGKEETVDSCDKVGEISAVCQNGKSVITSCEEVNGALNVTTKETSCTKCDDKTGKCADEKDNGFSFCTEEGATRTICKGTVSETQTCKLTDGLDSFSWTSVSKECPAGCNIETGLCNEVTNECDEEGKVTTTCSNNTLTTKKCVKKADGLKLESSDSNCESGCAQDGVKCAECTVENEATTCGTGKICVDGACAAAQCSDTDAASCKDDNKTLKKCENGRLVEKTCDVQCRDNDCRPEGYCSAAYTDPCKNDPDGKTTCDNDTHTCMTFACANAKCNAETENCEFGVCVPKTQDNTPKAACDKATFKNHCEGDKLITCMKYDETNYVVMEETCRKGCASFKKSEVEIDSQCISKKGDYCSGKGTYTECAHDGFMVTYSCQLDLNAVMNSFEVGYDDCGGKYCDYDTNTCYE